MITPVLRRLTMLIAATRASSCTMTARLRTNGGEYTSLASPPEEMLAWDAQPKAGRCSTSASPTVRVQLASWVRATYSSTSSASSPDPSANRPRSGSAALAPLRSVVRIAARSLPALSSAPDGSSATSGVNAELS